ncbi:MAG: L-lactate permease [Clostridiales bacterium]|nr:L-lactate permease [Clostridiales bacterium]
MKPNSVWYVILSVTPILCLVFSLMYLKLSAWKATLTALILSVFIALTAFHMPVAYLLQASAEGFMLALFPILWVIISALFVYNTTVENGSMLKIKNMLSGISPDRRIQALILAFGFGGFLEAVAGFGTAVAIPASILVAMGFEPLLAAVVCLVANTVPVAFGVLGIPIMTLSQVTSLSLENLSFYTSLQLIPLILLLPSLIVLLVTGSLKNMRGMIGVSLSAGAAFAIFQTWITLLIGPELAAVCGSLAALAVIIIWTKLFPVKHVWLFPNEVKNDEYGASTVKGLRAAKAWAPYILILLLVIVTNFIPLFDFLHHFPFEVKKQFYFGPGGKPMNFQLATGAGTLLFLSGIIGGLIQGDSLRKLFSVFLRTVKQTNKTIITVFSIVIVAKIMGYSGMVSIVAASVAALSGKFYPLIAPFIGALGTFITGSDTSSNVLFGGLQKQTALQLNMNPDWIVSSNASGATAGKMVSPQSISIASASVGLDGKEGKILSRTMKYCFFYTLFLGLIIFLVQQIMF